MTKNTFLNTFMWKHLLSNAMYDSWFIVIFDTLKNFNFEPSRFAKPLNAVLPIAKAFNRHNDDITCIYAVAKHGLNG